jgi:hypothetical protein
LRLIQRIGHLEKKQVNELLQVLALLMPPSHSTFFSLQRSYHMHWLADQ